MSDRSRYVCSECGDDDVEESAWIKANDDPATGRTVVVGVGNEGPMRQTWCPTCEPDHYDTVLIQVSLTCSCAVWDGVHFCHRELKAEKVNPRITGCDHQAPADYGYPPSCNTCGAPAR